MNEWMIDGRPVVMAAGRASMPMPASYPIQRIAPAGQVAVTTDTTQMPILASLLGLAVAFGVVYAGAYYGSRKGARR